MGPNTSREAGSFVKNQIRNLTVCECKQPQDCSLVIVV